MNLFLVVFAWDVELYLYLIDEGGQFVLSKYQHVFYGSSEKYILKRNDIKDIIFFVFSRTNSYYSISFRELIKNLHDNEIGEIGLLLQFLNENTIQNRYLKFFNNNPYKQNI